MKFTKKNNEKSKKKTNPSKKKRIVNFNLSTNDAHIIFGR